MNQEQEKQNCIPEQLVGPLVQVFNCLGNKLAENVATKIPQSDLSPFETQTKQTAYKLDEIKNQLENLGTNNSLLENANETIRQLNERFYNERIVQPMVRGLFPVLDLIEEAYGKLLQQGMTNRQAAVKYLTAIRTDLEQFLATYGIERFSHESEEPFDPKMMKPLTNIQTTEEDLGGRVAESLQCGFKMGTQVLRTETVRIFKHIGKSFNSNTKFRKELL